MGIRNSHSSLIHQCVDVQLGYSLQVLTVAGVWSREMKELNLNILQMGAV